MTEPYNLYGIGQGNLGGEPDVDVRARDWEYFQSLYPEKMKRMREYVSEACDEMDYKNSPMYDEYPDRMIIDRMCSSICYKITCENGVCDSNYGAYMRPCCSLEMGTDVEEVEAYAIARAQNLPPWGPPPRPHRPNRPPYEPNWMNDIVRVLLLNEIFNRRCKSGRCRW